MLQQAVQESNSIAGVLRCLNIKWSGGNQAHIKSRIEREGIDTSHMLGQRSNKGIPRPERLHWSKVLVRNRSNIGKREVSIRLRRAMLEAGIPYICERCRMNPVWRGKPLALQIDHIDGDFLNNEPDNVRFICPNCHTQTVNFGAKNRNRLGESGIDELYMWSGEDYEEEGTDV